MPKPHVLMLTPYVPYPPTSGGRSRTYNLLKHLSEHYTITLVCFGRPEETAFDLTPLEQWCELIVVPRAPSPSTRRAAILRLTSLKPITMRLYHTPEMEATVRRVLAGQRVDLIHVESFYMLPNLPAEPDAPVLLSEPAIEYVAWGRHARVAQPWYTRPGIALEALKMRLWEPRAWSEATVVGTMSDVDAAIIHRATPGVLTVPAPNGVDVQYFHPADTVEREPETAIYLGDYKYFPNADAVLYFAQEILPRVRRVRPGFQFIAIGKDPTPDMLALQDDPARGVHVTGMVDDTRPYFQRATVFVCPLRSGSGTRFKLMEALACGCPVMSRTSCAQGLYAGEGAHMLSRDDPQAFADAILALLDDPARAAALGTTGREWVVANHAWSRSAELLRAAYDKLIGHEDPTVRRSRREMNRLSARQSP